MDKETARIFARCASLIPSDPFDDIADAGQLQPPVEPKRRSEQDLLAERRANVLELGRETDPTARALLQFHIDEIDRKLDRYLDVRGPVQPTAIDSAFAKTREVIAELEAKRVEPMLATATEWSPAQHCRRAA